MNVFQAQKHPAHPTKMKRIDEIKNIPYFLPVVHVELFNKNLVSVAEGIVFSDGLPEDYCTESGFQTIIHKHKKHPSILKINANMV